MDAAKVNNRTTVITSVDIICRLRLDANIDIPCAGSRKRGVAVDCQHVHLGIGQSDCPVGQPLPKAIAAKLSLTAVRAKSFLCPFTPFSGQNLLLRSCE